MYWPERGHNARAAPPEATDGLRVVVQGTVALDIYTENGGAAVIPVKEHSALYVLIAVHPTRVPGEPHDADEMRRRTENALYSAIQATEERIGSAKAKILQRKRVVH